LPVSNEGKSLESKHKTKDSKKKSKEGKSKDTRETKHQDSKFGSLDKKQDSKHKSGKKEKSGKSKHQDKTIGVSHGSPMTESDHSNEPHLSTEQKSETSEPESDKTELESWETAKSHLKDENQKLIVSDENQTSNVSSQKQNASQEYNRSLKRKDLRRVQKVIEWQKKNRETEETDKTPSSNQEIVPDNQVTFHDNPTEYNHDNLKTDPGNSVSSHDNVGSLPPQNMPDILDQMLAEYVKVIRLKRRAKKDNEGHNPDVELSMKDEYLRVQLEKRGLEGFVDDDGNIDWDKLDHQYVKIKRLKKRNVEGGQT